MNKEQIYDEQVEPLMAKIIEICKANKIAMVATYAIPNDEDPNLRCTTALVDETGERPHDLQRALLAVRPPAPAVVALTVKLEPKS